MLNIRILICLCCIGHFSFSQQDVQDKPYMKFKNISGNLGLPGEFARSIIQDKFGFIWFGTDIGFKSFDGYGYKQYFLNDDDIIVTALLEDEEGNIWAFASGDAVYKLDRKRDLLKRYQVGDENFVALGQIYPILYQSKCMFKDGEGKLWVGTYKGYYYLDSVNQKFEKLNQVHKNYTGWVFRAGTNMFYEVLSHGLRLFNSEDSTIYYFRDINGKNITISGQISHVIQDKKGLVWISTLSDGIYEFNRKSNVLTNFRNIPENKNSLSYNWVGNLLEDSKQRFWIAANDGGIDLFDRSLKKFYHFQPDFRNQDAPNSKPYFLMEDKDRGLWISHYHGGISYVGDQSKLFINYGSFGGDVNSLSSPYVMGLSEDPNGNIWISTDGGGVNCWDRKKSEFIHYRQKPKESNSLRSDKTGGVIADKRGYIWVYSEGLDQFNPSTGKFKYYEGGRLYLDRQGKLWMTSQGGIYIFDYEKLQFILTLPGLYGIYQDMKGNYWVGTKEGFCKYDMDTQQTEGCIKANFYTLDEDTKGNFWFLLFPQGDTLLQYSPPNQSFIDTVIIKDSRDHLSNQLIIDNSNNVWIGSKNGIYRYDPLKKDLKHFDYLDGLASNFYRFSMPLKTKNGELIFGSNKGFTLFHPDSIKENTSIPPVYITSMKIFNKELLIEGSENELSQIKSPLKQHLLYTNSLILNHSQNDLTFGFTALNYNSPEKNQFRYKLEGYDPDWTQTSATNRMATYTNLPPGTYTFRVIASNNDGVWNQIGDSLSVRILSPWYWSWWTKLIYLLTSIGLIYLFVLWKNKAQRLKIIQQEKELTNERQLNERLQQLDKLKDQFLANTSHELKTPLQGIIGISEHLYDNAEHLNHREIKDNLSMTISSGRRLSRLVDDILDFSKIKNTDIELNKKPLNLFSAADVVVKSLNPLLLGKDVKIINDIPDDLIILADENRLLQVLFNLVGNAIKFTENGYIKLFTAKRNELIEVAVQDTGIGIPEDKREAIFQEFVQGDTFITRKFAGTGLGLSISKQLIELHGGEMYVESEINKGSTFFFTLPGVFSSEVAIVPSNNTKVSRSYDSLYTEGNIDLESIKISNDKHNGQISILIVDDEPINQQVLRNHLASERYKITSALNGEEAIRVIESGQNYDLVLLDIMMPRISGYEVCEKIRRKYLANELPVILVTAKNQVLDLVHGLQLGANDYLAKPFSKAEFLARVKNQLNLLRINEATSKFVPNEFLRYLGKDNITEVSLGDFSEQEVTVMFSDIRDYTTISEGMSPETNFRFVNSYHSYMGPLIQKNLGFVNQYLGDGIMAIFPNAPSDALHAAIDMHKSLIDFNNSISTKSQKPIRIGIGLHTGNLIMGIIGDEERYDAATIADTVNTASRMESLTKYYGVSILITGHSILKISKPTKYNFRYLGKVQVKGKTIPVDVFECFDGDPQNMIEKKIFTLDEFNENVKLYFDKSFAQASVGFEKILKINKDDSVAKLFLQKAAHLIGTEISEDWTGIEMMSTK